MANPQIDYWRALKNSGIFSGIFSIAIVLLLGAIAFLSYSHLISFQEGWLIYLFGAIFLLELVAAIIIYFYLYPRVGVVESFLHLIMFVGFNLLLIPGLIAFIYILLMIISLFSFASGPNYID
jgi:hypothetical protein